MATDRYIVVLDLGTSCARCFVFNDRGQIMASRSADWSYVVLPDASPFAREFDVESVWAGLCRTTTDSLRDAGAAPDQVAAVTVTTQRQGMVFLDAGGSEIYAGPNLDLRAIFEGGVIDEEMRDRVYHTTGHTPSFLFAPAKLRWFQAQRPDAYSRIASVLTLADWLIWRLSGALVSEPTLAGEAGLLDVNRREWCTSLLSDLGLTDNAHIPLVNAGTTVGTVGEKVSRETGIPAVTPVVVSGADTHCGLLGMGVSWERQVGIVAGWSAPIQMVTGSPLSSKEYQTWAGCFLREGLWTLESSAGDAGNSYRWLADTLWGDSGDAFREMDALAAAEPAGSEGALAFLGPSRMDMDNLGLRHGGVLFPVPMTMTEIKRGHLARAALEGMAYAMKANLEQVGGVAGETAVDVALGGGMIQTSTFSSVLVDVLGRPVRVSPTPHVSALGAYLCAATALGEFASLSEAAESVRGSLKTAEPDPVTHSEYQDHYQRWTETQRQLQGLSL